MNRLQNSGAAERSLTIRPGGTHPLVLPLTRFHWYDFSLRIAAAETFVRRYARCMETGKAGFSDPATGRAGRSKG